MQTSPSKKTENILKEYRLVIYSSKCGNKSPSNPKYILKIQIELQSFSLCDSIEVLN